MKALSLTVKNIGPVADSTIPLNKPLVLLYGDVRAGKTTHLKAVIWVFGGPFPQDIIKHGEKEGSIELQLDGGCIIREFYRSKSGETKARDVQFVKAGKLVPKPVTEIQRFLNPFLLNQNFLLDKSEAERKAFFQELFALDTSALDTEAYNNERKASNLRSEIKGYGEIDLTPVEMPNAAELKAELQAIKDEFKTKRAGWEGEIESLNQAHSKICDQIREANRSIVEKNAKIASEREKLSQVEANIVSLEERLASAKELRATMSKWLTQNPAERENPLPHPPDTTSLKREILNTPDTSALEAKISNAAAQEVRYNQFKENQERAREKAEKYAQVLKLEARGREIKKEKQALLKGITDQCKVKDLAFDEAGSLIFEGTTAGMLSTSQIMRLSSALSALYPEGFGIELLDRGESLGRSIFEFVDRAKAENKTILASIVGERPAIKVPDDVGVFVVEKGKATPAEE